ncbi:MAG: cupredoxin domain-containing protein, partial [Thermomicrobiales bacterium]
TYVMMTRGLVFGVAVFCVLLMTIPAIARQGTPGTPAASPTAGPVRCDEIHDATPVAATPAASPTPRIGNPVYTTGPVTIRLTDEGFVPDRVLSAVGHDLTVTLTNTGARPHAFCSERLDVDVELAPGESTTIQLDDLPIGRYPFISDLPEDAGMRGQLTIFI